MDPKKTARQKDPSQKYTRLTEGAGPRILLADKIEFLSKTKSSGCSKDNLVDSAHHERHCDQRQHDEVKLRL
jgi:hypothetical protein